MNKFYSDLLFRCQMFPQEFWMSEKMQSAKELVKTYVAEEMLVFHKII